MTTPPPPQGPQGPWPNQPPAAGQPPTPAPGQPYGPPPGQYPGWPPAGPPKKSDGLKWVLAGVALIAVIAVAVTITVVVLRSDSGNGSIGGTSSTPDIASANDTGPVGIITAEPTCDKFIPINNALAAQEKGGWSDRDPSIPVSQWSGDQRAQYEEIGTAMRNAADQYVTLAKQTPHRVVRELYEQSIAYARSYADSIPNYTAHDDQLVRTFIGATTTIVEICDAITYGSAGARSILVGPQSAFVHTPLTGDPAKPTQFLTKPDSVCSDWITASEQFNTNLGDWAASDAKVSATQWSPDQRAVQEAAAQFFLTDADKAEELSQRTANPILGDFLALAAQYKRVYAKAIPTYVAADGYLANAGNQAAATVYQGCLAASG